MGRSQHARNYLIPQGLASEPTAANLKAIEAERQAYMAELARQRSELEAQAKLLQGKEFTITARANVEGHLYGSVGPAQIAAEATKEGIFIEPENIALDEPIRKLDKYEVAVRFAEDVQATIVVWVVPPRESGEGEEGQADGDAEAAVGQQASPDEDSQPETTEEDATAQ